MSPDEVARSIENGILVNQGRRYSITPLEGKEFLKTVEAALPSNYHA